MQKNNFSSPVCLHCPSDCASHSAPLQAFLSQLPQPWENQQAPPQLPHTAPLLLSSLQKPQSRSSSWLYLAEPRGWGWLHFSPSPGSQPLPSAARSPQIHTWHIILSLSIILPRFFHLHISLLIYNSYNLLSTVPFLCISSLTHTEPLPLLKFALSSPIAFSISTCKLLVTES